MSITIDKSVKEEIIDLARLFAQQQKHLEHLAARLEEREQKDIDNKLKDVELHLKEAINSAKWLRAQNLELENKLKNHKPELDNALSARDSAFSKLKHARKVIKDLLQERNDMASPLGQGTLTREDIERALYDEFRDEVSFSSSAKGSSPMSDKTIRLPNDSRLSSRKGSPAHSEAQFSPKFTPNSRKYDTSFSSMSSFLSGEHLASSPVLSQSESTSARSSPAVSSWNIHFKKPPGSSVLNQGPFSWSELASTLNIDGEELNSLYNLASSADFSMRIYLKRVHSTNHNIAFLYDPIFIENRQKSYLLDYGRTSVNQKIEQYISEFNAQGPVFHLFTFPLKENAWYYIGAHRLTVVELPMKCWPLVGKSKDKMLVKLRKRTGSVVNETEVMRLLDSDELQSFGVELMGIRDRTSHEFVVEVLEGRSTGEARHERRAEGLKE